MADTEQTAWARGGWQKIFPYSTGGTHVNYLSAGEDMHSAHSDACYSLGYFSKPT